jgi:hypothetical protein
MALKRDHDAQVNLEKPVHDLMTQLADKLGVSTSAYLRQLILNDLRDRGLMSDRQIADMAMAR